MSSRSSLPHALNPFSLTSGISAEYGRFSGGVVNIVTKRGGDVFSGSYRENLRNLSWTDETPFETRERPDRFVNTHEATFGGPIVRARLWFFGAGRLADTSEARTLAQSGIGFDQTEDNKRYEIKLTGTAAQNHTFQGSWMDNRTTQANRPSLTASIDPRTLDTRTLPNDLFVVNYSGVLTPKLFTTFQVSQKRFGFRENGGSSSDIRDSPFFSAGASGIPGGRHYNAPCIAIPIWRGATSRRCCWQGQYRMFSNLTVQGHWTVQLQNEGNFEGEASNQPGAPSLLADYPEVFTEARNSRWAARTTSSVTRCGYGPSTTSASAASATSISRACIATTLG